MNALTFQIHLHEPVLVTQVGSGDSNSAVGFDFIPGSVIRGALIGRYLQRRNEDKVDDAPSPPHFHGAGKRIKWTRYTISLLIIVVSK